MRDVAGLPAACVHFGRTLRAAGLPVTSGQIVSFVTSLRLIDMTERTQMRDAGRAIFVTDRDQRALFDRAFDLFWSPDITAPSVTAQPAASDLFRAAGQSRVSHGQHLHVDPAVEDEHLTDRSGAYSVLERLKQRDFAALTNDELDTLRRAILDIRWRTPTRRTRRFVAARRGQRVDLRRTLRSSLHFGGEALRLAEGTRKIKPRPLVVLCDVSGSMERYTRILLQFVYAIMQQGRDATPRMEVFVFSTRLTRITRQLTARNADQALRTAAQRVSDWAGGTRIGGALRHFNIAWSRRVLGQGSLALIISDGCDRGDVGLLAQEMERLRRSCHRLIWLNPLLGDPAYQPLTRGMAAALPHVDFFLPIHNLVSLQQLDEVLASVR